jgi:hypothetical protein
MGDYFDLAADLYGLPRPPRVPRDTATAQLPLMLLSFMSESRRMDNTRLKTELRVALRYATVAQGLRVKPAYRRPYKPVVMVKLRLNATLLTVPFRLT